VEALPAFAEESRFSGAITFSNYWQYFRAGAGYLSSAFFIITLIATQLLYVGTDYWLTQWTNAEEVLSLEYSRLIESNVSETLTTESSGFDSINLSTTESYRDNSNITVATVLVSESVGKFDRTTYVNIYSVLVGCFFIFTLARTMQFFAICMSASIHLHNKMFKSIIRSKVIFFDQNPVGNKYLVLLIHKIIYNVPLIKDTTYQNLSQQPIPIHHN